MRRLIASLVIALLLLSIGGTCVQVKPTKIEFYASARLTGDGRDISETLVNIFN